MKNILILITLLLGFCTESLALDEQKKEFNPGDMIFEHIQDDHSWHILTYHDTEVSIPLPVILFHNNTLSIFLSNKFNHGHSSYKGYKLGSKKDGEKLEGKIICVDSNGVFTGEKPLDFSITKNVLQMFIVAFIMIFVVFKAKNIAKKRQGQSPKGTQTIVEFVVLFIRDDIALPSIGIKRYKKFMPFLLTVFCFIFLSNIMGLVPIFPGGANLTGNIAVTLVLALFTFCITNFSANKAYFKHIVNMPGVPWWLKFPIPIMPIVETLSVFTKPFALTIRLFANITAGHIIILGFLSIIFIFGSQSVTIGYGISFLPVLFSVFMSLLEILVAFIQAYVFTLLSAIYIGMAYEEHPHVESSQIPNK
ncbi:MAG: F0F1 ATP synthase subunit A [Bacteroidales bacterium]|nr:F0F1 ATP synthase subunit A [Bacteroidales bacterium]